MNLRRFNVALLCICLLILFAACGRREDGVSSEPVALEGTEGISDTVPDRSIPTEDFFDDGTEDADAQEADVQGTDDQNTDGQNTDDQNADGQSTDNRNADTEESAPLLVASVTEAESIEKQLVKQFADTHEELVREVMASVDGAQNTGDGTNPDADDEDIDPNSDEINIDGISYEDIEFLGAYHKGVSDVSVAYIQQRLMDLGFMDYAEPTQYYGSMTSGAVLLFQRQNELKQDGILGSETRAMLFSDDAKRYTAKMGMSGDDIKRIQTRLYELGYLPGKDLISGDFDSATDKAVKAMQTANGLNGDGLVGQMTVELIYSEEVVANLISFGDKGDIILACQKRLKELGYLTTTPDGNYGNDTLAAVKLFQSRNNLVVDGYLGPSTREVLDSSSAIANGLAIGDEGDTVKRVQKLLIKYGYMNSGSDTGYFGEVTDKAVKSFQNKNGLKVDGHVGAKTMAKLTGDSVVRAGDSTGGGNGGKNDNTGGGNVDTGEARSGSVSELLEVALSKLGCKYVWGAKGPNQFDCSGFVYWCLNQVGVKQSYITSYGWRTVGKYKKITSYSKLKAGDIIVVTGHVGIIGENGTVIDASSSRGKISHRNLSSWWSSRFICGWRIFE